MSNEISLNLSPKEIKIIKEGLKLVGNGTNNYYELDSVNKLLRKIENETKILELVICANERAVKMAIEKEKSIFTNSDIYGETYDYFPLENKIKYFDKSLGKTVIKMFRSIKRAETISGLRPDRTSIDYNQFSGINTSLIREAIALKDEFDLKADSNKKIDFLKG